MSARVCERLRVILGLDRERERVWSMLQGRERVGLPLRGGEDSVRDAVMVCVYACMCV